MSSVDVIERLIETKLTYCDLRYCLVTENKLPKKINGDMAKPNNPNDFVSLSKLLECDNLNDYAGVGISIQASNICAIDIDHCFAIPNDMSSGDNRAKDILEMFKDTYCEFSFSGTGLRILFLGDVLDNLIEKYYIKNSKTQCEYYQPLNSYRYVTVTGNYIYNNNIEKIDMSVMQLFLNKYMLKPIRPKIKGKEIEENVSFDELLKRVRILYLKDDNFQNLWFGRAPGSGKNESELDYKLIITLFTKITQNREMIKAIVEQSPYFKSKDYKHKMKWKNQEGRYYNYVYDQIYSRTKGE